MKASPFTSLVVPSWLIVLAISIAAQSGQYTVQVDSMTAQEAAESKVQTLKKQGQNAYWLKSNVPGQGVRYRVRIGRFPTRAAAQIYGARLKQQSITSDFFVALWEGASSPLGAAEPVKKSAPPVLSSTPKAGPAETKAVENNTPLAPAQRQREVKPSLPSTTPLLAAPTNTNTSKPANNGPAAGTATKPLIEPTTVAPVTKPPSNNPVPKPLPATPTETKPLQSKPLNPTALEEIKAPREKKVENAAPTKLSAPLTTASMVAAATKAELPTDKSTTPAGTTKLATKEITTPASPAPMAAFQRFEERTYGYSFEHPMHWNGGRLNVEELQAQRIDAGAVFRSQEDVAFMNAIWNSLKNANSPSYDNNLIVDLVIKSLSSGTGLQGLSEISRRMVQEGDQIKTFVDLRTLFRQPRANSPLEFQGKAVIIRANTGILLVVSFYSKESAPAMVAAAERIISSARVP
jgi:hypothetical protein